MNRAPAFQCYANDQLAAFTGLSLAALGAVHRLHLIMWGQAPDQCSLLDDDQMLTRTLGCSLDDWVSLRSEIQHPARPIFEEKNGRLFAPYLRQQAAQQRKYRKLQKEKSLKGVAARVNQRVTRGLPTGSPTAEGRVTSSSSTSTSTSPDKEKKTHSPPEERVRVSFSPGEDKNNGKGHAWQASFERFKAVYPRNQDMDVAERWFKKHQPPLDLVNVMLAKIAEFNTTDFWQKENGRFVPLPATWLTRKRWQDVAKINLPRKQPQPVY